jgi:gas vesicle protein
LSATEWNNLSSGLLGAVIGAVVGSLAGFVGSMFLNWQSDRSKSRAAGRALLAEVTRNFQALAYVGEHLPAGYSESVLKAQLPLVARLLSWGELQTVLEPYLLAAEPLYGFSVAEDPRDKTRAYQAARNHAVNFERNAQEVLKKCQEELTKVREKFARAAEVLRSSLLDQQESRDFSLLPVSSSGSKPNGDSTPSI